jgi:hypothetical protein
MIYPKAPFHDGVGEGAFALYWNLCLVLPETHMPTRRPNKNENLFSGERSKTSTWMKVQNFNL